MGKDTKDREQGTTAQAEVAATVEAQAAANATEAIVALAQPGQLTPATPAPSMAPERLAMLQELLKDAAQYDDATKAVLQTLGTARMAGSGEQLTPEQIASFRQVIETETANIVTWRTWIDAAKTRIAAAREELGEEEVIARRVSRSVEQYLAKLENRKVERKARTGNNGEHSYWRKITVHKADGSRSDMDLSNRSSGYASKLAWEVKVSTAALTDILRPIMPTAGEDPMTVKQIDVPAGSYKPEDVGNPKRGITIIVRDWGRLGTVPDVPATPAATPQGEAAPVINI